VRTKARKWFTRRPAIITAAVIVVLAAGAGIWLATSSSSATPLISSTTTVQKVSTGTITQTVSSSGTIQPAQQASLNFGQSGRVTAVDVSAGQTVTAGQALATIDTTSLAASLAQAQANLANDQAQLTTDEADSASSAQIASDQAGILVAQNQVTNAQTALGQAALTSTIAGTVASISLTVGQQVTGSSSSSGSGTTSASSSASSTTGSSGGGSNTGGGTSSGLGASSSTASSTSSASSSSTAQVVVVSTGSYLVDATVDSTQVGQLKVGDQATITVSGSTTPVYGTVGSIGLLASTTSGVASFPVVVDVTGSPSGIYGGSSATLSITTEELQDVVVVPTAAIHYSGNDTTVLVDSDGTKVTKTVQIGAASGGDTQITSGLSAGDKVYVTEVTFHGGLGSGSGRSGVFGGAGGGFDGTGRFSGGGGFTGGAGRFGG
jgi:membrane fusion protein, macrolide-specific efflux system